MTGRFRGDWRCRHGRLALVLVGLIGLSLICPAAQSQVLDRGNPLPAAEIDLLESAAATHLENAARFLAEKQWEEAVDAIRRLSEGEAGRLAPADLLENGPAIKPAANQVPRTFERFVSTREFTQWRLAALAAEAPPALEHYRKLVDPLAADWLKRGLGERDETLLRRVVEEAFASRSGDAALLALGDIALERGDYSSARDYWQRILPGLTVTPALAAAFHRPVGSPLWLALREFDFDNHAGQLPPLLAAGATGAAGIYPDSKLAAADLRARLALVSLLEGSLDRAAVEIKLSAILHPDATGQIAGRAGTLSDLLTALLQAARAWRPPTRPGDWPQFAGNRARNAVAVGEPDIAGRPLWTFALPRLRCESDLLGGGRLRPADDAQGLLSYHPIIVGGAAIVRVDAREKSYVCALDLKTGKPRWQVDFPRGARAIEGAPLPPVAAAAAAPFQVSDAHTGLPRQLGVARYTLSATGPKLFARVGNPVTLPRGRRRERLGAKEQGWLVGLDLRTQGKLLDGFPIRPESPEWSFAGSPIAEAGNLYVLMRRAEQGRRQLHCACFELPTTTSFIDDSEENSRPTGRLKWRTKIVSAASPGGGDIDELSHELLTLESGALYVNTHLGAIAALSAADGRLRWLVKYPRAAFHDGDPHHNQAHFFRDLTPCLVAKDLVIAAPSDCQQIFALERGNGRLAWALPAGLGADVMHLLGVGGGSLVASGDFLYWIDVETGQLQTQFPASSASGDSSAAPSPRGLGRGTLVDGRVYWPTRESIYVFGQTPARAGNGCHPAGVREIPLAPRGATGGNLMIAEGTLLIATADRLFAFAEQGPPPNRDPPPKAAGQP